MQVYKSAHFELRRRDPAPNWRSRIVVLGVMSIALAIYLAGIVWFGRGLAEDVRAGVRDIPVGALVPDRER